MGTSVGQLENTDRYKCRSTTENRWWIQVERERGREAQYFRIPVRLIYHGIVIHSNTFLLAYAVYNNSNNTKQLLNVCRLNFLPIISFE